MAKPSARLSLVTPEQHRHEVLAKPPRPSSSCEKAGTPWPHTEVVLLLKELRDQLSLENIAEMHLRPFHEIIQKAFECGIVLSPYRPPSEQKGEPEGWFKLHIAEWEKKRDLQGKNSSLLNAIHQWVETKDADRHCSSWAVIRRQLEYIHQKRQDDLPGTFDRAFVLICRGLFSASTVSEWMAWFEHPSRVPIKTH